MNHFKCTLRHLNMSIDNVQDYGNTYVVIRGLSSFNNSEFPVAVVVDGVPQGNQKQLKMNLFDVQSIEVLKGPQGTLYGRNAIGGAINIETKQPKNKFEGFAGFEVGNGGATELTGGLGGAIVDDRVLLRVVGQTKKSSGLIESTTAGHGSSFILRSRLTREVHVLPRLQAVGCGLINRREINVSSWRDSAGATGYHCDSIAVGLARRHDGCRIASGGYELDGRDLSPVVSCAALRLARGRPRYRLRQSMALGTRIGSRRAQIFWVRSRLPAHRATVDVP